MEQLLNSPKPPHAVLVAKAHKSQAGPSEHAPRLGRDQSRITLADSLMICSRKRSYYLAVGNDSVTQACCDELQRPKSASHLCRAGNNSSLGPKLQLHNTCTPEGLRSRPGPAIGLLMLPSRR